MYAGERVGPLSATDLLVALGAVLALPALASADFARLRPLLTPFAVYLVLLIPTLVMNPGFESVLEWLHRVFLVAGAVVVGAWLVVEHRVRMALRLLTGVSIAWALAAMATAASNGFAPAYPLGYHKNFVGSLLAMSLLAVLILRPHVGLSPIVHFGAVLTIGVGAVATQSRGALLGATLGVLVWFFVAKRAMATGRAPRLLGLLVAVAFAGYASYSVQQQLVADNVETSSIGVRQDVEAYTYELWQTSPVVGIGIRYFRSGEDFGRLAVASNNAINSELAESGLFGATGFVIFQVSALFVLFRRRHTVFGVAALAAVSGKLLHGMFDIYWSAGVSTLPWILAGLALASRDEPADRA